MLPAAYSITGGQASASFNNGTAHTFGVGQVSAGNNILWVFNLDSLAQFGAAPSLIGSDGITTGEGLCLKFNVAGTCEAALFNNQSQRFVFTGYTSCGSVFADTTQAFVLNFATCPIPAPVITADTAGITCNGHDTVTLIVSPSTGSYGSDVHFNWSNGMSGDTIRVVQADTATTYTVTVGNDSCVYIQSITIQTPPIENCCFADTTGLIRIMQDTLASQLSIPIGSKVYVADTVTITVDSLWILQQCEVALGTDAEIIVKPSGQLELNGSYLHACDTMWRGITLEGGSLMFAREQGSDLTVIKDAHIAILSLKGGELYATNTDFINNRIGVQIVDGGIYAGTVGRCNFEYQSPGLLPPYSGRRPLSGIYVLNTNAWTVPVADTLANTFTGLNNGIAGFMNKQLHIKRNLFTDIKQYEGCISAKCVALDQNYARLGCAVYLSADPHLRPGHIPAVPVNVGAASVSCSRFRNCYKGVKSVALTVGVTQDTMTNMTYGVDVNKSWYKLIAVGYNVMDTVSYGVSLKNNVGASEQVYNNNIQVRPLATTFPYSIGSIAGGPAVGTTAPVAEDYYAVKSANGPAHANATDIYQNTLRQGRNTVVLESPGSNTVVRSNAIYQDGNQNVLLPQKGIYVRGGEKFRIYDDTIYGLDSAGTTGSIPNSTAVLSAKRKQGIFLDNAKRYEIRCTQLEQLQQGMVFQGNCGAQPAAIHENRFNYYRRGLGLQMLGQYGSVGGAIGGLDSTNSNIWYDGPSNDVNQWETYNHTDNSPSAIVTRLYWPNGQVPTSGTFDNKSNFASGGFNNQGANIGATEAEDCEPTNELRMLGVFDSLEYAIAVDSFEFSQFAEVSKWQARRDLYAKIREQDTLTDSTLLAFANANPRDGVRPSVRYASVMQLLSDSTLADDSLQVAELLFDAYNVLDSLPDDPAYVRNIKETGKLLIRVMALGESDLDSTELVYVETMAFSCPYIEGEGVYTARYLYSLLSDTTYYIDDMLLCTEDTVQAKWEGAEREDDAKAPLGGLGAGNLQLVPNPAKDVVAVIYSLQPNEKALLSLYSLTGQLMLQKEISGSGKTLGFIFIIQLVEV